MISGTWRLGQIAGQHDEVVCGDHHHSERNTGGCSSRQVLALAPSGRLPKNGPMEARFYAHDWLTPPELPNPLGGIHAQIQLPPTGAASFVLGWYEAAYV
jgi:hypothetical protein